MVTKRELIQTLANNTAAAALLHELKKEKEEIRSFTKFAKVELEYQVEDAFNDNIFDLKAPYNLFIAYLKE